MKNIIKRLIAIVLILCCVIPAAGVPSFAAPLIDDYDGVPQEVEPYIPQGYGGGGSTGVDEPSRVFEDSVYNDGIGAQLAEWCDAARGSNKVSIRYNGWIFYAYSLGQAIDFVQRATTNSHATSKNIEFYLEEDITESVYVDIDSEYFNFICINLNEHTWSSSVKSSYRESCLVVENPWVKNGQVIVSNGTMLANGIGYECQGSCIDVFRVNLYVYGVEFKTTVPPGKNYPGDGSLLRGGAISLMGDIHEDDSGLLNADIMNCNFTGFYAVKGGAVYCTEAYDLDIQYSNFTSCKADFGGALFLDFVSGRVLASTFDGCTASSAGGAIEFGGNWTAWSVAKKADFEISSGVNIRNCYANLEGGAISMEGRDEKTLTLSDDCTIENCISLRGGALSVRFGTAILKEWACIKSCTAGSKTGYDISGVGGAVFVSESGTLVMDDDAVIHGCSADVNGSAIYVSSSIDHSESGTAVLKGNCSIHDCKGNAIYADDGGSIEIQGGEYRCDLFKADNADIKVSGGWFNKRVAYPAPGWYATSELPGIEHIDAPYTVVDRVVTVNFYGNNGTGYKLTYADIPPGKLQIPYCDTYRTDYNFAGWAIASPDGEIINPGEYLDIQKNTDFYATWIAGSNALRTVTFIDPISGQKYEQTGRTRTVKIESQSSRFKRANYHIASFNTKADGSGTSLSVGNVLDFGNKTEVTLYVIWADNLDINGGKDGVVYSVTFKDSYMNSRNADYLFKSENESIILMDNGFVRTGEVLAGWSTLPSGNGTIYQLGDRYTFPSANSTLYAYWVSKSVSTYHAGDSGQSQSQSIVIDIDPSHSSGGEEGGGGTEESTSRRVVFYDPTGNNAPLTLRTYDSTVLIYAGGFRRSGYKLGGWNTQANGKGTDYKNGEEYTFGNSNELILYAMWKVNKNDVVQGESGSGASQEIINAFENNDQPTPGSDWDPTHGQGGEISGDVPPGWREQYIDRPYYDVDPSKYYYDAVIWAEKIGATGGIVGPEAELFNGSEDCTRGDMVTLLWEIAGEPKPKSSKSIFTDVKEGMYYSQAIAWANEQGIILGVGDNKMDPMGIVTRAQVLTVLWRYHGSPSSAGKYNFIDVVKGSWYEEAVKWGVEKQITLGTGLNRFSPEVTCSRGEIVTFVYRDYKIDHPGEN